MMKKKPKMTIEQMRKEREQLETETRKTAEYQKEKEYVFDGIQRLAEAKAAARKQRFKTGILGKAVRAGKHIAKEANKYWSKPKNKNKKKKETGLFNITGF